MKPNDAPGSSLSPVDLTTGSKPPAAEIKLVLADVDGTLITKEKILTPRAIAAVRALGAAGIAFAVTSGRPPRGMQMLIEPLALTTPIAAFNGGLFINPDLSVIEQHVLQPDVVEPIIRMLSADCLDVWIYRGVDWYVPDRHGRHVDREEWTVKFPPKVVPDFHDLTDDVAKIVGVSDDLELVARCEAAVREHFEGTVGCEQSHLGRQQPATVSAARSQPYYLDVTHPSANKGAVVLNLSRRFGFSIEQIATLGDMPNDISMFQQSGLSIAMGQASAEVKNAATFVSTSAEEEGFAHAIERYILPQA